MPISVRGEYARTGRIREVTATSSTGRRIGSWRYDPEGSLVAPSGSRAGEAWEWLEHRDRVLRGENGHTAIYDANGRLARLNAASDEFVLFGYDGNRLDRIAWHDGGHLKFLKRFRYLFGHVDRVTVEGSDGNIISEEERFYDYDRARETRRRRTHSGGRWEELRARYHADGNVAALLYVKDRFAVKRRFVYSRGRLVREIRSSVEVIGGMQLEADIDTITYSYSRF